MAALSSDAPPAAAAVIAELDRRFDHHLAVARDILRQRSISADGDGIDEMAATLHRMLLDLGADSEIISTPGFPVVLGSIDVGAPRTLVVYGMYDTMPVEGETWIVDPFEGAIVDLPDIGPSIVARGAENSKGPLAAWLNVLEAWKTVHGRLPVNVKFVLEGEEELGSPSLADVVRQHRDRLAGDGAIFPALLQTRSGKPVLTLGFKGIAFYELSVRGGSWGGPTQRPLHSSKAVWYDSPVFTLVQALATLTSTDQREILVDGFTDDVAPIPDEDRPLLADLARTFDPDGSLREDDAAKFKWDERDVRLLERYLYEPSVSIDGLGAGDMGPGAKTILPHEARAKLEFRLVPNQSEERVTELLRAHFERAGFPQVDVHLHSSTNWSRTSISSDVAQSAIRSCRSFGLEPEVWPRMAGSGPMYLFTEDLGIPFARVGLGHGGGAHAPDEYMTVEGLRLCEHSLAVFLADFAGGSA